MRHRKFLIDRHLRPTARIAEGRWLSAHRFATSAIDISDGLSGDLRHICEESHVGAKLDLGALPLSPACRAFAAAHKVDPIDLALTGGEDYELLFTIPQSEYDKLVLNEEISVVGYMTEPELGQTIITKGGSRHAITAQGWNHLKQ